MNVGYVGGKQMGVVGLLTLKAVGQNVQTVVAHDSMVKDVAYALGHATHRSIHDVKWDGIGLIVNVHGRELFPEWMLKGRRAINAHPCVATYPGKDPVGRMLQDGRKQASVAVHYMTPEVDKGSIIAEQWVSIEGLAGHDAVYNRLMPVYATTLLEALGRIGVILT
jgi:methionyl-tRNA formyltransferase